MACFDGTWTFLSKRRSVDRMYTREVVVRYPHGVRNKLLLDTAPHLTQREQNMDHFLTFSTNLDLLGN